MARRRSNTRSSFGVMWLGLLSLVVVGWMGWRSGWWPVDVAPAETTTAVDNSSLEQARRAATLENRVTLPEQFEPPVISGQQLAPIVADSESSFPAASANDGWRPIGGSTVAAVPAGTNDPAGSPQIRPVAGQQPVSPGLKSLSEIDSLIAGGDVVAAHKALSWIYFQQPGQRAQIASRIERTAAKVYFSPRPHVLPAHTIQPGDSLAEIAPRYKIGWQYLSQLNQVKPNRIRAGQALKVLRGPFRVVVDLSEFSLLVRTDTEYVCRFPIGIGRDHSTPIGRFRVLRKVPDPQYTDPDGRVIASATPENPLGRYWIDIGEGYGIHGTNQPDSIGRAESRGCMRMRAADIRQLFGMLVTGCEVVIHR